MQFFQTAVDIQNELIKFCMNENNIPKKYRFVYTMPIIAEGQALVNNVVSANTIFVKTNEEVIDRRHYQNEANANCEKILQQLQSLRTVRGADSEQLKIIVGMIISEKGYITAKKCFEFVHMSNIWTTHSCYSKQRKKQTKHFKQCSRSMKAWELR